MLVRVVRFDDEMVVELIWHVGLDVTQEDKELLMPMAAFVLGDDRTVRHVGWGCRAACGSMAGCGRALGFGFSEPTCWPGCSQVVGRLSAPVQQLQKAIDESAAAKASLESAGDRLL
jgi:hypothetical protein